VDGVSRLLKVLPFIGRLRVACSEREKVDPERGKIVFGPAEKRVILALSEVRFAVPFVKRNE